jgi:hypothetical protein
MCFLEQPILELPHQGIDCIYFLCHFFICVLLLAETRTDSFCSDKQRGRSKGPEQKLAARMVRI